MNASVKGSSRIGAFRIATPAVVATVGAVPVQCTSPPPPPPATSSPSVSRPAPSVPAPPASAPPAIAPPARPAATVHPVTATELGASWRPGCPLEPGRLRRVEINHIGFDGQTHRGALIVHEDLVTEVITIFEQLHQLRYPIEKIRAVNQYPGAHDESRWKTTTPRRSTAEASPEAADGLSTPTVELLTSTHFSIPTSTHGRIPTQECRAIPGPQPQ